MSERLTCSQCELAILGATVEGKPLEQIAFQSVPPDKAAQTVRQRGLPMARLCIAGGIGFAKDPCVLQPPADSAEGQPGI